MSSFPLGNLRTVKLVSFKWNFPTSFGKTQLSIVFSQLHPNFDRETIKQCFQGPGLTHLPATIAFL